MFRDAASKLSINPIRPKLLRTFATAVLIELPTPNPKFDKARDGEKPVPKNPAKKQAAK